jgi:hypothetical protein
MARIPSDTKGVGQPPAATGPDAQAGNTGAPADAPKGWTPPSTSTSPTTQVSVDLFRSAVANAAMAARLQRVGHDIATVKDHYNFFALAFDQAASKSAKTIIATSLKGVSREQAKLVFEAAQKAAGRRTALYLLSHWEGKANTVGKVVRRFLGATPLLKRGKSADLEVNLTVKKALDSAVKAASRTAREEGLAPELAKSLGEAMGRHPAIVERVSEAAQLSFKLKWLGRVVPVVGAGLTFFDARRAWCLENDPKATALQKVCGWLTAAADVATFVPIPLVSLAAGVISIPISYLRDARHPVRDLERVTKGLETQAERLAKQGLEYFHLGAHAAPAH